MLSDLNVVSISSALIGVTVCCAMSSTLSGEIIGTSILEVDRRRKSCEQCQIKELIMRETFLRALSGVGSSQSNARRASESADR
jgi:hypothetical protein